MIVLVLAVSALLARGYLKPVPSDPLAALKLDLKLSLDTFWGTSGSQVDAKTTPQGIEMRVAASIPPNTRPRQRGWTHSLVGFVVSRHARLQQPLALIVVDQSNGQPIPQSFSSQSKPRPGGAFSDPAYFEAARGEILQRNAQQQLDSLLGAGRALVLVEVQSGFRSGEAPPPAPGAAEMPTGRSFSGEAGARPRRPSESVPSSSLDSNNVVQFRATLQIVHLEACVVFQRAEQVEQGLQAARTSLEIQPGRGDVLRQVILPALAGE
jgi:hypothetical protein